MRPPRARPAIYRPRQPRATPLYRLLDARFEAVKGEWEERFESHFGFWRGCADGVVARYLDCGILENGFARVRCAGCRKEMLVAFSCRGRGLRLLVRSQAPGRDGEPPARGCSRTGRARTVGVHAMVANVSVRLSLAMELPVRARSARANELIRQSLNTIRGELRGDVRCQEK